VRKLGWGLGLVLLSSGMVAAMDTGLTVQVYRGPITPLTRIGVDNAAPVDRAVVRVLDHTGHEIKRGTTNTQGETHLALKPGQYTVQVMGCGEMRYLPEPETVTVSAQKLTKIRFDCDTGIR